MKPIKSLDEKITHLVTVKNIRITDTDFAKSYLKYFNYINVIYPYKRYFYAKNNGKALKVDGKHVYPNNVEFCQYVSHHQNTESTRDLFVIKVIKYEMNLKAFVIEELLNIYHSYTSEQQIFDEMRNNFSSCLYSDKPSVRNVVEKLEERFRETNNFYVALDKMNLGQVRKLIQIHSNIFNIKNFSLFTFGANNFKDFVSVLYKIIHIRNYALHGNNIAIALYVEDIRSNTKRKGKSIKYYQNALNYIINYDPISKEMIENNPTMWQK